MKSFRYLFSLMTHYRLRIENMHMDAWETEKSVIYHHESLQQTPEGRRWKTPGGDRKSERKKQAFVLNMTLNSNMQRDASMFVFSLIDSLIVSIDYVSVQSIRYFTSFKGNCKVLCWFMNRTFPFPPHLQLHIKSILAANHKMTFILK